MTFLDIQNSMYRQGLLDERKRLTFGVMTSYLGEFSCAAAIKGNTLRIYKSDASMNIGTLRHEFAICNLTVTKTRTFPLAPIIEFQYAGKRYTLRHFGTPKEFVAVFMKENEKG